MPNGKIIKYGNNTYVQHDNVPVDWVMTGTNYTALQNQIASIQPPDVGAAFKIWKVTSKRDTLASIIDFEPSACLLFNMYTLTPTTIGNWFAFATNGLQWWMDVSGSSVGYRQTASSIKTMRYDDMCQVKSNPTYPINVACIIWK